VVADGDAMKVGNITVWLNVFCKTFDDDTAPAGRSAPRYRGKLDIDGKTYEVSLWVNENLNGAPIHLSGQICEER